MKKFVLILFGVLLFSCDSQNNRQKQQSQPAPVVRYEAPVTEYYFTVISYEYPVLIETETVDYSKLDLISRLPRREVRGSISYKKEYLISQIYKANQKITEDFKYMVLDDEEFKLSFSLNPKSIFFNSEIKSKEHRVIMSPEVYTAKSRVVLRRIFVRNSYKDASLLRQNIVNDNSRVYSYIR